MLSTRTPRFREAVVDRCGASCRSRPLEKTEATVASGFKQCVNSLGMAKCKAPSGTPSRRIADLEETKIASI
jgi:hypothetical protein